tara:strand:- start:77 stop:553 length:477 start_codon:yes stop_codon:yes gene_type:complete
MFNATEAKKLFELSQPQMFRGKPTRRRCVGVGKRYFWKDLPVLEESSWIDELREENGFEDYDQCLINFYPGGAGIGFHTDKTEGMDTSKPVWMINFGITEDWNEYVGKLGKMKLEDRDFEINSEPIRMDAYTLKHSATTRKCKDFKWRMNITFRKTLM